MKKIISLVLTVAILASMVVLPMAVSAESTIYVNEPFSGVALNGVPSSMTLAGNSNNRVVKDSTGNKVLKLDLSRGIGKVSVPFSTMESVLFIEARYKANCDFKIANLFKLKNSGGKFTDLLSIKDGAAKLAFGQAFNGLKKNAWNDLAICVDYANAKYTIYLNGKEVYKDWAMETMPLDAGGVDFEFIPVDSAKATAVVEMDDIRVYGGSEKRNDLPSVADNSTVLPFEETSGAGSVKFYMQNDYDNGSAPSTRTYYPDNGNVPGRCKGYVKADENNPNNKYYILERYATGGGTGAYIEYTIDQCDSYNVVFEFDYRIDELNGAPLWFYFRDTNNTWSKDIEVNAAGKMVNSHGQEIPLNDNGKWTHLAFAFDYINHVYDIYVDKKLIYNDVAMSHPTFTHPNALRMSITGSQIKELSMAFDNFYIYEADKPMEDLQAEAAKGWDSQFLADNQTVKTYLGTSMVYNTHNGALYKNGEKTKTEKSFFLNDRTMVPVRAFSEAFDLEVGWDGDTQTVSIGEDTTMQVGSNIIMKGDEAIESDVPVTEQNDRTFLPLRVLAEKVLGKEVLWNDNGLIFIDNKVTVNVTDKETLNMALRYMLYDEMTAKEFTEKLEGAARPRLLIEKDRFETIKKFTETSELGKKWLNILIEDAETWINDDYIPLTIKGDMQLIRTREWRIQRLGILYHVTGDEKYARRAWGEALNVANYENWNPAQYLNTSACLLTCALTYDWFYDYLTEEQRTILADNIVKKGLMEAKKSFSGKFGKPSYIRNYDNWSSVCNSGIICAAVAIGDRPEYKEICSDVFYSASKALAYIFHGFMPDGGWREGPGYSKYTTTYLVKALGTMDNTFGTDLGWSDSPGFKDAGWFLIDMIGPKGYNNAHDAAHGIGGGVSDEGHQTVWWATKYNDPALAAAQLWVIDAFNLKGDQDLLMYFNPEHEGAAFERPYDNMYRDVEFAFMRGATWQDDPKNALWLSFHAGLNGFGHGQLDAGTFTLDMLGERWAEDIGTDSYSLPNWGDLVQYCRRAEGHNLYVINPDAQHDQNNGAFPSISKFVTKGEKGGYAIADLSQAYNRNASKAYRGFMIPEGRNSVIIRDEITLLNQDSTVYWFWHMANMENIETFGNYAILTKNGKQIRVDFLTNGQGANLSVMNAESLPTSPPWEGTVDYSNVKKLAYKLTGSGTLEITVKVTPLDGSTEDFTVPNVPLSAWDSLLPQ